MVNGSKTFITGGVRADVLVTAVRTKPEGGHHGISFLIVDRGEGVESRALEKMGWHASDTAEISFDDVFVPEENLLGAEHGGFYLIMANFQWERLLMALGAVGGDAGGVRADARLRARAPGVRPADRQAPGDPPQAGRDRTPDRGRARRHLRGAAPLPRRRGRGAQVTMAKLATQRAAFDVMDSCLQIHGGAGYMVEYGIERAARDARLGPIGGGTDEIMKEILGRSLGL